MARSLEERRQKQREASARYAAKHSDRIKKRQMAYYWTNVEKRRATNREWYKKINGKRQVKDRRDWLRKYGLTINDYAQMLQAQEGKCAICATVGGTATYAKLGVDHNHTTNKVRSLLCRNCNLMLGHAKDNPMILRYGAKYIEQHGY